MNLITAIILGLVQGLTEFIPVSSSGHIILAQHLFDLPSDFKFDVLLNIGTLLALVVYYRRTIAGILSDVFTNKNYHLAVSIIVATIPAVVVGLILGDAIEGHLQSVWIVAVMLALVGALMVIVSFKPSKAKAEHLSLAASLKIGLAQAIALIPGTSRSGATILAGQSEGLSSEEAARFSFMLAIPTILGATLKIALSHDGRAFLSNNLDLVIIGNLVSFISGILAIKFLISILGRHGLRPFGWYRLALSGLLIVLIFAKLI